MLLNRIDESLLPAEFGGGPFARLRPKTTARLLEQTGLAGESVALLVRLDSLGLVVRDFAAFLALADGLYGRTISNGQFLSYSLRRDTHLRIREANAGSIELAFPPVAQFPFVATYIVVYLCLKSLPKLFTSGGELLHQVADSYRTYEEARAIREDRLAKRDLRRAIRNTLSDEAISSNLDTHLRALVSDKIETLLVQESGRLPSAARLMDQNLVAMQLRTSNDEDGHDSLQ